MERDIGIDDPQVRVRSGKESRPRTEIRPDYSSAHTAEIVGADRDRYRLVSTDGLAITVVEVRGLGRGPIVVDGRVRMTDDVSRKKDILARVVSVEARAPRLLRNIEGGDDRERCIVANAQQLTIVITLAGPPSKTGMIDRCLVAAYDTGMEPLLMLTKTGLASPDQFFNFYGALGLRVVIVGLGPHRDLKARRLEEGDTEVSGLEALREVLAGVETVLVGHSGIGKLILINALVPDVDQAMGGINAVTGKGRHTPTPTVSLTLPGGGRVIDTPGVRSSDLAHVSLQNVLRGSAGLAAIAEDYPHGCEHGWDSPECALSKQTDLRFITQAVSFRRLLAACTEDWN